MPNDIAEAIKQLNDSILSNFQLLEKRVKNLEDTVELLIDGIKPGDTVYQFNFDEKTEKKPKRNTEESLLKQQKAAAMTHGGHTRKEIAKALGVSKSTVGRLLKRHYGN